MAFLLTAEQAAAQVFRSRSTVRNWVHEGHLKPAAVTDTGTHLFRLEDVFAAERRARHCKGGRPRRHAA